MLAQAPLNPGQTVRTPERVAFSLPLASLGSRALALSVDYTIMLVALCALLYVVSKLVGSDFIIPIEWLREEFAEKQVMALTVFIFLMSHGFYFIFFEWLLMGQTPGKKALGIRVVRDEGFPITFREAFLRNLLRHVDFLPMGYGLGLVAVFMSTREKRLGDVVSGTIVVMEEELKLERLLRLLELAEGKTQPSALATPISLAAADFELLQDFFARANHLAPEAREAVAKTLTARFLAKIGKNQEYLEQNFAGANGEVRFLRNLYDANLRHLGGTS